MHSLYPVSILICLKLNLLTVHTIFLPSYHATTPSLLGLTNSRMTGERPRSLEDRAADCTHVSYLISWH